jgi:hypothetical protein
MTTLNDLKPTTELCVFFVCTENEVVNEGVESTLWNYLNLIPSEKWKIDLYLYLNKVVDTTKIKIIVDRIKNSPWVNKIEIFSLDLSESEDVFWYPWLKTPKPKYMPEYGYTSGANLLFYRSIRLMMGREEKYKNFLMLESDSIPLKRNWFDVCVDFCLNNEFEIAGSKYKGDQIHHKTSNYKDHLNGIAIYRNSKKLEEILSGGEAIIKAEMPDSGFLNFDIANFLFYSKYPEKYKLIDTEIITNMSDSRDFSITNENVIERHPETLIVHKKNHEENPIISQKIFDRNGFADLPVCLLQPHSGCEYILDISFLAAEEYLKKDPRYDKAVKLKIISNHGSKITLFAVAKKYFDAYPKSFFTEIDSESYIISYFNLAKLIEDKYIKIISMALDFRATEKLDQTIFAYYIAIINKVKKSPYLYSFCKHAMDLASSSFVNYELLHHHRSIDSEAYRRERFLTFISTDFSPTFLSRCFFGKEILNDFEASHLFYILEKFQMFDIKLLDEVLCRIYQQTYGISLDSIDLTNVNLNPTTNKITITENEVPEKAREVFRYKSKLHSQIYNEITIKELDVEPESQRGGKKIPSFLHVPKNAGSFVISLLTKYFARMFSGDKHFNLQRMQVDFDDCSHATFFIFFKQDDWKDDEKIRDYKFNAPRSRSTDRETLLGYIKDGKAELLAAIAEPAISEQEGCKGEVCPKIIMKSFDNIWSCLVELDLEPLNFTILRDPLERAISLYNYINSSRSKHEDTHKSIETDSLNEYLASYTIEDSWLIRALNEIPTNEPIEYRHLDNALDFLIENEFLVEDIKRSEQILKRVLNECYGSDIDENDLVSAGRNDDKTKAKKRGVPNEIVERFKKRTFWDEKLYLYFC